ncbi:hypothetical protein EKD00_09465 [Chlorobium phaeovibrioides]|uniref:hypothetical protein n=1 Tax=Chlorobium phaeovibrioides TaxID=1094 RepID=UPI000F83AF44|nr:hypothetical protein [Chlorobium phaeovibrioides]RTY33416.1 hypothetical protein EKD00_09465 [Chlorobium phaeovibrioides]
MTTAKQNQKFPFHFFFRFAVEGWGEETREKCKEIFWFLHTRVRERVRGAFVRVGTVSERTVQFQATTRSARAISRQNPADFARNTFELRPIHTAKIENRNQKPKWGRREAPTQTHSRQEFPNPKGFSTLRVAHSFANTILGSPPKLMEKRG